MNWRPWRWIAWVGKAEKMPWRQLLESPVFKDLSPRYRYTQEIEPPTGLSNDDGVWVGQNRGQFQVLVHPPQVDVYGNWKQH